MRSIMQIQWPEEIVKAGHHHASRLSPDVFQYCGTGSPSPMTVVPVSVGSLQQAFVRESYYNSRSNRGGRSFNADPYASEWQYGCVSD
ncbi:hypothetical protein AVEN_73599-1 [Araneus ventricosus]|uniref:Uncharacterized protein n=1 Tax=Araneus ventricosus TaxID=182803 RepID=A0A4Y2SS83_ARAVE|nr:hypothetical protein AVEN_73599-1 [Araneus ventricosus]